MVTGFLKRRKADRLYQPAGFGLVAMLGQANPLQVVGTTAPVSTNRVNGVRAMVPFDGILVDLNVWIGGTIPAHIQGLVYDTGDKAGDADFTSAGVPNGATRSRLDSLTAIAAASLTANAWNKLGDPNVTVYAGQHLDLAVQTDDVAGTLGRANTPISGAATLPPSFMPCRGGALPKFIWGATQGSFAAPASVAEASCVAGVNFAPVLFARVIQV